MMDDKTTILSSNFGCLGCKGTFFFLNVQRFHCFLLVVVPNKNLFLLFVVFFMWKYVNLQSENNILYIRYKVQ